MQKPDQFALAAALVGAADTVSGLLSRTGRTLAVCLALVVVVELAGIWSELAAMRREQVKSTLYALPVDVRQRIEKGANGERRIRALAARTNVAVDDTTPINVEVHGSVKVEQPVAVTLEK